MPSDVGLNLCPECGAALDPGESCEERFHRCLALEYEDWTGYGAVHHLTVPAYMLQHPGRYSREGGLEARRLLAAFLSGKAPTTVRSQNRAHLDSGRRPWRMAGGEPVAPPAGATWSRTISDVRMDDPATYCAGVVEWARAVLADTAGWEN